MKFGHRIALEWTRPWVDVRMRTAWQARAADCALGESKMPLRQLKIAVILPVVARPFQTKSLKISDSCTGLSLLLAVRGVRRPEAGSCKIAGQAVNQSGVWKQPLELVTGAFTPSRPQRD